MVLNVLARFLDGEDVPLGPCPTVNDVRVCIAARQTRFAPDVILLTQCSNPTPIVDDGAAPPERLTTVLLLEATLRSVDFWRKTLIAHALAYDSCGLIRAKAAMVPNIVDDEDNQRDDEGNYNPPRHALEMTAACGNAVHCLVEMDAPARCTELLLAHVDPSAAHYERGCLWGQYHPLYVAACRNNVATVDLLLRHQANVNHGTWTPWWCGGSEANALRAACKLGHINIVRTLIVNGADVREDRRRASALAVAWKEGRQDICEYLVSHGGANVNEVCRCDYAAGIVSTVRLGTMFGWNAGIREYLVQQGGKDFMGFGGAAVAQALHDTVIRAGALTETEKEPKERAGALLVTEEEPRKETCAEEVSKTRYVVVARKVKKAKTEKKKVAKIKKNTTMKSRQESCDVAKANSIERRDKVNIPAPLRLSYRRARASAKF
eukprot:GEMP01034296.1.p1 GENE.GEMP01034296.1~~GEMP01034296.1.p1  ORF type:complete len:436 (+),score=130.92 GEMP01034296.1:77-1384(+)